jgi:hypothetical protein
MKVLCLCQKGNSRSVALAFLLKKEYHLDTLSAGLVTSSSETLDMLFQWCDVMILTSRRYLHLIPDKYRDKLKVWHVGTDRFFRGFEPELLDMFHTFLREDPLCPTSPS